MVQAADETKVADDEDSEQEPRHRDETEHGSESAAESGGKYRAASSNLPTMPVTQALTPLLPISSARNMTRLVTRTKVMSADRAQRKSADRVEPSSPPTVRMLPRECR